MPQDADPASVLVLCITQLHDRFSSTAIELVHCQVPSVRHIPAEQYDLTVVSLTAPTHCNDHTIRHVRGDKRPIIKVITATERMMAAKARSKVRNLPHLADSEVLLLGEGGAVDRDPFVPLVISSGGLIHGDMRQKMKEWR